MATLHELGRMVKTKYPGAYDDLSNEALGQRVQQKYPNAYGDFVDVSAQSAQSAAASQKANSFSGILGNTLKALPGELGNAFLKTPARFVASAALAPTDIARGLAGKAPQDVNLPGVGRTFQSQANQDMGGVYDKAYSGQKLGLGDYGTALKPFAQVPLAAADTLATVSGAKGLFGAAKAVPALTESAVTGAKKIFGNAADKATANLYGSDKAFQEALSIVRPKVTPKIESQAFVEGRVGKQGLFSGANILPSSQEKKVAEAVQPLVESGIVKKGAPPNQNAEAIKQEVSRINQGVGQLFDHPNSNPIFNRNELRSALMKGKDDLKIVFASDPTTEKTYNAVVDAFIDHVKTGDLKGVFQGRQSFDNIPAVKKLLDGLKGAQGENLRREVVLTIRNGANDFVATRLPKNNPYSSALKTESYLLRAVENMGTKIEGITQGGKVQRFLKSPAGKAVGIGAGVVGTSVLGNAAFGAGKALLGQ